MFVSEGFQSSHKYERCSALNKVPFGTLILQIAFDLKAIVLLLLNKNGADANNLTVSSLHNIPDRAARQAAAVPTPPHRQDGITTVFCCVGGTHGRPSPPQWAFGSRHWPKHHLTKANFSLGLTEKD